MPRTTLPTGVRASALSLVLLFLAAPVGRASVHSEDVTKENLQRAGIDFTVRLTRHPDPTVDTIYVAFTCRKAGKLAQFREAILQVNDGNKLTLRVPVHMTENEKQPGE